MIICEACNGEFEDNDLDDFILADQYGNYICKSCYQKQYETCQYCINRRTEEKKLNILEYQLHIEPERTHRCNLDMSIIQLESTCSHFDYIYNHPYAEQLERS